MGNGEGQFVCDHFMCKLGSMACPRATAMNIMQKVISPAIAADIKKQQDGFCMKSIPLRPDVPTTKAPSLRGRNKGLVRQPVPPLPVLVPETGDDDEDDDDINDLQSATIGEEVDDRVPAR